jgi:hypothetical protein
VNPWPYGGAPGAHGWGYGESGGWGHPYAAVPVYEYVPAPGRVGGWHAVRVGEAGGALGSGSTVSTLAVLSVGLLLGVLLGRLT